MATRTQPGFVKNMETFFTTLDDKLEKPVRNHVKNVYSTLAMALLVAAAGAYVHVFTDMLRVDLTESDVDRLLDVLVYDASAEKVVEMDKVMFRSVRPMLSASGMTQIPCTFCPVKADCQSGSAISPENCAYFKEWLAQI